MARSPPPSPFEEAATVPGSALAALQGVRDHAKVTAGQQVLVIGASGGVGTFAAQIAGALGATVTGVCSTAKVDLVRSLGAGRVVGYTREDHLGGSHRYGAILDTGGHRRPSHLRRVLSQRGRLVVVGSETGGRWLGGTDRQLRAMLWSRFVRQTLTTFVTSDSAQDPATITDLVDAGRPTPVIDTRSGETTAAVRYVHEGRSMAAAAVMRMIALCAWPCESPC